MCESIKRALCIALTLLVLGALLLAGCGPTPTPAPTKPPAPTAPPVPATPVPTKPAAGEKIGGSVSVLAVWGGDELESFKAMIKPFEDSTGVKVEYEGTRDLNAVLTTRVQGGNPPDLAGLPGPGQLQEFAKSGKLVALDNILDMNAIRQQYDAGWLNLATYNGKLYGIFSKAAVKSLVWYNPKVFKAAGYEVPKTWDELMALTAKIAATGKAPWCIGLESGAASGWPATDWIEDIMLRTAGVDTYDKWWKHQIPWTDPAVKNGWTTWGKIVANDKYVFGGKQGVLSTNFGQSPFPMFTDPPGCYMHRQASFITDFIQKQYPKLKSGEDFNFFPFPPIDSAKGNPLLVAGDLFGMFRDTPQSRALIKYLTTADAQSIWAKRGGFLSANKTVPPSVYPDLLTQQIADMLARASAVRFDASDLMPEAVNSAFWKGTLDYVQNPANLDNVLTTIERAAKDAYK